MIANPDFFHDLAYVFLAALLGGGLAWWLRQPLILGYVVGGILISPLTPGLPEQIAAFAGQADARA
jgi:K+:H+ antiporter